jgi:hypothetical protein
VGTSRYRDVRLPNLSVVRRTVEAFTEVLTDPRFGCLVPEHCKVLINESDIRRVGRTINEAALSAEDLLLVYYCGHGLVGGRRHDLYLSLPDSEWTSPEFSSLEYDKLRSAVLRSPAATKLIVLDCCFSGRALGEALGAGGSAVVDQMEISGSYVLTSSQRDQVALAMPDEPYTAFTGRLIQTLRGGLVGGAEFLTLDSIYEHILATMNAEGLPLPERRATRTANLMALGYNRAHKSDSLQHGASPRTVPASNSSKLRLAARPDPQYRRSHPISRRKVLVAIGGIVTTSTVAISLVRAGMGAAVGNQQKSGVLGSQVYDGTVEVSAQTPWNDTGIDILTESKVVLSAEGIVYIAGSDDGKSPAGVAGCVGTADRRDPPGPHLVPGLTCVALVGRIGNGAPFEVGRFVRLIAPSSGHLFLGVNDNFFGDNSGSWTVRVSVRPP